MIDRLLVRDEFSDYWAMKWCDLLRVKSEFPIDLWPNAVQEYYRWIRNRSKPTCRTIDSRTNCSRQAAAISALAAVNFYRAVQNREPQSLAQAVALTFMGVRTEKWPAARRAEMAVFFSQVGYKPTGEWKEEIVFFDRSKTLPASDAVFPDGTKIRLHAGQRSATVFYRLADRPAESVVCPQHRQSRLGMAVRTGHHRGTGRHSSRQSSAAIPILWIIWSQELISSRYDLKHIYRLILNSKTYQLRSIPRSAEPEAEAKFACYPRGGWMRRC